MLCSSCSICFFFFKQKTAYEMRISDWSSDVCSSDLLWQLHRIDPNVPRGEQFGAVKQLLDEGVIRFAGLSEVTVEEIEAAAKEIGRASCRERVCQYV